MKSPLSSIKILDFSTLLPGPFATMMLADMGADILWVDSVKSKIDQEAINKISLFCNVKISNVIPALNASSIYEVPSIYSKAGLDKALLYELGYDE